MRKQFKIQLALLAALAITLGGCASHPGASGESSDRKLVGYDEINQEYQTSISKLDWPKDYTPPESLQGEDKGATFQSGYGDTWASHLFECSWEREWIKTYSTDKDRANAAIAQLKKIPDMPYMSPSRCDDATRKAFNDQLKQAEMGDPSGFQNNINLNCPS